MRRSISNSKPKTINFQLVVWLSACLVNAMPLTKLQLAPRRVMECWEWTGQGAVQYT